MHVCALVLMGVLGVYDFEAGIDIYIFCSGNHFARHAGTAPSFLRGAFLLCLTWWPDIIFLCDLCLLCVCVCFLFRLGDFWTHMVDAAQNTTVSYSVVINPNSGPGEVAEDAYTQGIYDLWNADIEVRISCCVRRSLGHEPPPPRTLGV